VCPVNMATYTTQEVTCESSLYFQRADSYSLCRRTLLLNYRTPTLQRHDSAWVFYFPERRHVVFRCWENGVWTSRTEALIGSGIIYNTSGCAITASGFQTWPDLQGDVQVTPDAPRFYVPERVTFVANYELQILEESIPSEARQLDEVVSGLNMPLRIVDINSVLYVHRASINREKRSHWYLTTPTILCALYVHRIRWLFLVHSGFLLPKPEQQTPIGHSRT
jgi:hypothetical protein